MTDHTPVHLCIDEQAHRIILTPITREYVNSLCGKYKGKGLLQTLMAGKKRERKIQMLRQRKTPHFAFFHRIA